MTKLKSSITKKKTTHTQDWVKNRKDWLNKENIIFLLLGSVSKAPGIFSKNGRFSAKMGGWNLLQLCSLFQGLL